MADTAYDSPYPPPAANVVCGRLCRIGKIAPWILEKRKCTSTFSTKQSYLPFANDRAALRERPRCPSRTTALLFANGK